MAAMTIMIIAKTADTSCRHIIDLVLSLGVRIGDSVIVVSFRFRVGDSVLVPSRALPSFTFSAGRYSFRLLSLLVCICMSDSCS